MVRALSLCLTILIASTALEAGHLQRRGEIERGSTDNGDYWYYRPFGRLRQILIIAHGTPGRDETADAAARRFIERWTSFAAEQRILLVAPAFDNLNFGGRSGPGGGYRGLFGREVGADDFVLDIVERFASETPSLTGPFLLYGHSAGGQFACRFLLTHPERLRAVVLSAPGRYAFPDLEAAWPYGLKPIARDLRWKSPEAIRSARVTPERSKWLRAAGKPVFVIVGSEDLERQPIRAGHGRAGETRVSFAKAWTEAMLGFARAAGQKSRIEIEVVDGVGHSSRRLTPRAQDKLSEVLRSRGADRSMND